MIHWQRKNSVGEYYSVYSGNFEAGTYRLEAQLRTDRLNDSYDHYRLTKDTKLTVNGQEWWTDGTSTDDYQYGYGTNWYYSPEVVLCEYNSGYTSNATHHWHACNDPICPITDVSKKSGYEPHVITDGTVTKKATATEEGQLEGTCTVCGAEAVVAIPKPVVSLSTSSYTYNGKVKSPSVVVKEADGTVLTKGVDYKVVTVPSGRKNVGRYTYKIEFMGDKYEGTATTVLTITPMKASVKSLTAGTKKLTVKATSKPSAKKGTYYQIAYKQKGTSTWKYTTTSSSSKTIKSLKKGKQYYVKIRAYKTVNGVKLYGNWSSTKLSKKIK